VTIFLERGNTMYLKAIEIYGFKSFGEKIKIEFNGGITSIVGPNGSGKSNILDAILWVLGEQSYKNIRAKESTDVIFSGGKGKGTASFAEVSLFIKDEEDLKITRRLQATGENEYYINDKKARLKDISDIFLDTGVGKSAYSVIGQGKVERIISSSSKEIKGIIEEAAGVKRFQQKKQEASKNLETVQEELEKIELIFNEVSENRSKVEKQAIKATEYLNLKSRRDELFKGISIFEKNEKTEKLQRLENENKNLEKILVEKATELKEFFKRNQELKNLQNEVKEKLEAGHEANEELKSEIELFEREKIRLKEREVSCKREFEEKEIGLVRIQETKERKETELREKELEKENLEIKLNENKEQNEKIEKEISLVEKSKSDNEIELDFKKKKIMEFEVEKLRLVNEIENGERRVKGSSSKIQNLREELKESEKKLIENQKEIEIYSGEKELKTEKLKVTEARIEFLEKTISETSMAINKISEKIRSAEYEEKRITSRLSALQKVEESNEGFFKGVKAILNLKMQGVEGVFISLIDIPEKLESAIEAAIPGNLQDIVVTDAEVAKRSIDILKERKLGRASFLALDTIKVGNKRDIPRGDGIVGRAADLVITEEKYKSVVEFLLGNVIIVEKMDIGLKILKDGRFSGNIVTLSGELLSNRGRITGGDNSNSVVSQIFERRKEIKNLENSISINRKIIEENTRELDQQNKALEKFEEEICGIDNQQDILRKQIKIAVENLETYSNQKNRLQKEIKIIEMELEEEENYAKEYEQRITLSQDEKINIEETIEKLKNEIDSQMEIQRILSEKLTEIKNKYSDIKIKYLNGKNRVEQLSKDIIKDKVEIEKVLISEIVAIQQRISYIKEEEREILKNYQEIETNILGKREKFESENRELFELKKQSEELVKEEKEGIEKRGKLETVLLQAKNDIETILEKKERLIVEIKKIEELLVNFEEISPVKLEKEELGIYKEEERELSYKLRTFQNINLLAVDEFKELDKKYNFILSQKEDLVKGEKTLRNLIHEIQNHIEEKFFEAYHQINQNFDKMCVETLDNSEGKLILSEEQGFENCGVEIFVKYKNKKRQALSLLSGGEKSMVAIAFIMAIFMYKPSPFTFLDEIEAALDDKNTRKLIAKLKEFTDKSQFILITHNKETMKESDSLFGVTMNKEIGISKIIPVKV
jgi:chromosome segregation protein